MGKTWHEKDGRWYKGDRLIENPAGYGATCRARFLSDERRKNERRPIHFSSDCPIPAEYNKPLPDNRLSGERRVNAWGMPIADDQPLNDLPFYLLRAEAFITYLRWGFNIKVDTNWLLYQIQLIFQAVKECREQGPQAVRRRLAELSGISIAHGRLARFIALLHDIAASPGWFATSREGRSYLEAVVTDMHAAELWKHPRPDQLRRRFRFFIPRRCHHRGKSAPRWKKK